MYKFELNIVSMFCTMLRLQEFLRQLSMRSDHEVWLAVLVDDLAAGLQPQPAKVLRLPAVSDEARTASLYHCRDKNLVLFNYYLQIRTFN